MKLIVGLGNPGKEYAVTRHNAGFMVLDELARQNNIRFKNKIRFKASAGEGIIEGENCYLVKPQTFMNLSGNSVRSVINWLSLDLKDLLVVVDDIALLFRDIKIKAKGSDAGHKGTRSVITCLGSNDFSRMRIGIRGREDISDTSSYVLNSFTKKEKEDIPGILSRASLACECWIKEGIDNAMNKYNIKNQIRG
ncbi:MAG: aminoacyl-tRNA hydrolase [Candidatus Omnitrophota bacterium]